MKTGPSKEMLKDIKKALPNKKISISGALAFINGLASIYRKSIIDYSEADKMVRDTKMKEVIYTKYLQLRGYDVNFDNEFDEYLDMLPEEFASNIDRELYKSKKISKRALEAEIERIANRVLNFAVKGGIKEKREPVILDSSQVQKEYEDFASTDKILKSGLSILIRNKQGNEGIELVEDYVNSLAQKAISSEVDYVNTVAENVVRFYSNIEIARGAQRRRASDDYIVLGDEEKPMSI